MADVPPPNIAGSAAQAWYQQAEAAKARDAERASGASATGRGAKKIDAAAASIETTDNDSAVFSDAEGTGGQQGSGGEESTKEHDEENPRNKDSGVSCDDDGEMHLDVQA